MLSDAELSAVNTQALRAVQRLRAHIDALSEALAAEKAVADELAAALMTPTVVLTAPIPGLNWNSSMVTIRQYNEAGELIRRALDAYRAARPSPPTP